MIIKLIIIWESMKEKVKGIQFLLYSVIFVITFLLAMGGCQCKNRTDNTISAGLLSDNQIQDIPIPEQSDWIDHGMILEKGEKGEWDHYISGGFTGTVVKKDGTFFLYYQGANDYNEKYGTVTYRAIGVATSQDGVSFTKYSKNPVITWAPNNGIEEGSVSGGATLGANGEIVMYYGANTKQSEWLVNADSRLATSESGLDFSDSGIVLDHNNDRVWGSGDELFPIIAFHEKGNWYLYYIPNGTLRRQKLAMAWGPNRKALTNSRPVLSDGKMIEVWGMGGHAKIGADTYTLFINNVRQSLMEVRVVHLDTPDQLSAPIRKYKFDNFAQGTVFWDNETKIWFMFYRQRNQEKYGVKLAPVRTQEAIKDGVH